MAGDEFGGVVITTEVARESGAVDADVEIFADLEMQMCGVDPVRCPDGADLLSTRHLLSAAHQDCVEVREECVHGLHPAALAELMAHDDDIPPARTRIPRQTTTPSAILLTESPKSLSPPPLPSQSSPG